MGYNRAGQRAKVKLRRRRKDERRLALKSAPAKPTVKVAAKAKPATPPAAAKSGPEGAKSEPAKK